VVLVQGRKACVSVDRPGSLGDLRCYSGGLGGLAGDLLKEASDRALPLVAVGLLYRQGYFRQRLDVSGWQQEYWVDIDPERLPAALVRADDGQPLKITVPIRGNEVRAQIWRVAVGRVPLFLLDADVPENGRLERWISSQLYVADQVTRLSQYALLGIGGMRALSALGIEPGLVHLNEGHAAFVALELARTEVERGVPVSEALEMAVQPPDEPRGQRRQPPARTGRPRDVARLVAGAGRRRGADQARHQWRAPGQLGRIPMRFKDAPHVAQHVVYLHDYDLAMAARLVRGCDLWLNLPRPPLEASGTSGMKAVINGGINLSVLDGWWDEAYDGTNGWALPGEMHHDAGTQDARDASTLYRVLEQEVIPAFYRRDERGLPRAWLATIRASMRTLAPAFSAGRMLDDYTQRLYSP
jgi:glucan phosphorylase